MNGKRFLISSVGIILLTALLYAGCSDVNGGGSVGPKEINPGPGWAALEAQNPPAARADHAIVSLDDFIYVFGGELSGVAKITGTQETSPDSLYRYNVFTNEWQAIAPTGDTPGRLAGHTMVAHDGRLILFGGKKSDGSRSNDIWVYTPSAMSWEKVTTVAGPTPRSEHMAAVVGDVMVVAGGTDGAGFNTESWKLDLSSFAWQQMSFLPVDNPNDMKGGRLFPLISPYDAQTEKARTVMAYLYSKLLTARVDQGTWTEASSSGMVPPARRETGASSENNLLYIFGGTGANGDILSDTWRYNSFSETWEQLGDLPTPMTGAEVASASNGMYFFGGKSGDSGEMSNRIFRFEDTETFTITCSVEPPEGGTITVSPESRNGSYTAGTPVGVTLNVNKGYRLKEWRMEGDLFTNVQEESNEKIWSLLSMNTSLTAVLEKYETVTLTINIYPENSGIVVCDPPFDVEPGTVVLLYPVGRYNNYEFTHFIADTDSSVIHHDENGWSITMNDDVFLTAHFRDIQVEFDDAALREAVCRALGIASIPVPIIYPSQMATIHQIEASNKGIKSLKGIQHCTTLEALTIGDNAISDFTDIEFLTTLRYLDVSGNNHDDIFFVRNLVNLETLAVGGSANLTSIGPVENLKKLKTLSTYNSGVTSLAGVENLPELAEIGAEYCNISSLAPIANLPKLVKLSVEGNNITSISEVATLPYVRELGFYGNNITDISPLDNLMTESLQYVILKENPNLITKEGSPARVIIDKLTDEGVLVYWDYRE